MRIKKKVGLLSPFPSQRQNPAVPRFVARQMLGMLRVTHRACSMLEDVLRAMPAEARAPYEHLLGLELQPALNEVMRLIDMSVQRGLLTVDEAASLRAGRTVDNPLPDTEGQGAGAGCGT